SVTTEQAMRWRTLILGVALVISTLSAIVMMSHPAEARPYCYYIARGSAGKIIADGYAWAAKQSRACERAHRRCNREFHRKIRHGKAGGARCGRAEEAR